MQKTIHILLNAFGQAIKRKVLLVHLNKPINLHAVKSKAGFWYCGNLYDTSDIAYGIASNGLVEQEETLLVQKILAQLPADFTLLDIGANTGYYGIMSAYMYPTSKVHSFEPIAFHCQMIKESAYLNRLENITIHEYALGETNESKEIYTAGSGTTLIKSFTSDTESKIDIQVKKLDDVIREKNISGIDFIKIDVEGFEYEVLKGAKESLKSHTPILFVEICQTKDGRDGVFINENFNNTIELIEQMGYVTHILGASGLHLFNKGELPAKGVWMFLFTHSVKHKHILLS